MVLQGATEPHNNEFFYLDKKGVWQGPFSATQMLFWYRAGHLDVVERFRLRGRVDLEVTLGKFLCLSPKKICSGELVQRNGLAKPFADSEGNFDSEPWESHLFEWL